MEENTENKEKLRIARRQEFGGVDICWAADEESTDSESLSPNSWEIPPWTQDPHPPESRIGPSQGPEILDS